MLQGEENNYVTHVEWHTTVALRSPSTDLSSTHHKPNTKRKKNYSPKPTTSNSRYPVIPFSAIKSINIDPLHVTQQPTYIC